MHSLAQLEELFRKKEHAKFIDRAYAYFAEHGYIIVEAEGSIFRENRLIEGVFTALKKSERLQEAEDFIVKVWSMTAHPGVGALYAAHLTSNNKLGEAERVYGSIKNHHMLGAHQYVDFLIKADREKDALEQLAEMAKQFGMSANICHAQAKVLTKQNKIKEAKKLLSDFIDQNPPGESIVQCVTALFVIYKEGVRKSGSKDAIKDYDRDTYKKIYSFCVANPGAAFIAEQFVPFLIQNRQFDAAKEMITAFIDANKSEPSTKQKGIYILARMHYNTGEEELGRALILRHITESSKPEDCVILVLNICSYLVDKKNPEEAETVLMAALKKAPRSSHLVVYRAVLWYKTEQFDKFESLLTRHLTVDFDKNVFGLLLIFYCKRSNGEKICELLKAHKKEIINGGVPLDQAIGFLVRKGQTSVLQAFATENFEEAVVSKSNAAVLFSVMWLRKDYEKCLQCFGELSNPQPYHYSMAAQCHWRLGHIAEAEVTVAGIDNLTAIKTKAIFAIQTLKFPAALELLQTIRNIDTPFYMRTLTMLAEHGVAQELHFKEVADLGDPSHAYSVDYNTTVSVIKLKRSGAADNDPYTALNFSGIKPNPIFEGEINFRPIDRLAAVVTRSKP